MFLILEVDDPDMLSDVIDQIGLADSERPISINPPIDTEDDLRNYNVLYTSYPVTGDDVAKIRYFDLYMASLGGRYFGFDTYKTFPTYAGPKLETREELKQAIVDALYARARSDLFNSFGVTYIGRVFSDPRNILLVDNRKGQHMHAPWNSEEMANFYSSLHDEWWHDLGIVSANNVTKLEAFLDQIDYSQPLAYTSGARSKLKFCARDYKDIIVPKEMNNSQYGINLREITRPVDV